MDTIKRLEDLFQKEDLPWYRGTWVEQDATTFVYGIATAYIAIDGKLAGDDAAETLITEFVDALVDVVDMAMQVADHTAKFLEIVMELVMAIFLAWYEILNDQEKQWVIAQVEPLAQSVEQKIEKVAVQKIESEIEDRIKAKVEARLQDLLKEEILRYARVALQLAALLPEGKAKVVKFIIETVLRGGKAQFQKKVAGALGKDIMPLYAAAKLVAEPLAKITESIKGAQKLEDDYPHVWRQLLAISRRAPDPVLAVRILNDTKYFYFLVEDNLEKILGYVEDHYTGKQQGFTLA
ncbi:MAG TPA: hypothetical protein VGM54_03330 [Chthoniobacter sp.]|jgi:hypothetical protein